MNAAARYRETLEGFRGGPVRESPPQDGHFSELALQAQIYGGEFGLSWQGEDGEAVEVIHFGSWNREPGPDFRGAKVVINGVEMTGEIEIDPDVRDWENHGHSRNPNYNNVVLHLFHRRGPRRFFTRTVENRAVTQVCLAQTQADPEPRPKKPGELLDENSARILIEAAAEFRFVRKSERFRRSCLLCGRDGALFQSVATGLGYKNNKIPFLLVAQRAGLARAAATGGESLLFGLAGFLQADDFERGDDESRQYLRQLWEDWWTMRGGEARLVLTGETWQFAAVRPANHPHRRMGALAAVARSFRKIAKITDPAEFAKILGSLEHAFWNIHYSLTCDRLERPTALIGADRAGDLVVNALLPSLPLEKGWAALKTQAAPKPSMRVKKALGWICEGEPVHFLETALHQQGLLQLHEDFFPQEPGEIWRAYASRANEGLQLPQGY